MDTATATPSPATRRKRGRPAARWLVAGTGLLAVGLVALGVGLFAVALDSPRARAAVTARLEAMVGLPVSIDGKVSFSLLPDTTVTLERVAIGSPGRLEIERLVADLDLWEALVGRVGITGIEAIRPEYRPAPVSSLAQGPSPRSPLSPGPSSATAMAQTPPGGDAAAAASARDRVRDLARRLDERLAGIERIVIRNGTFGVPDASRERLSHTRLVLDHSPATGALDVTGSTIWNGQPTDFSVSVEDLRAVARGETSDLDLSLEAPPLSASFEGRLDILAPLWASGDFSLEAGAVRRAGRWLFSPERAVPALGPVAISGHLATDGRQSDLSGLDLTLADSRATGAMEIGFQAPGVPSIEGTLAFRELDLAPFGRSIAPLPDGPLDLERPIELAFLNDLSLDLRLSADRARAGGIVARDAAALLSVEADGTGQLDIGHASLLGGNARGTVNMTLARAGGPALSGSFEADDLDAARLAQVLGIEAIGVSGRSALTADFQSPLTNWSDILTEGRGRLSAAIDEGRLTGFDPMTFAEFGVRSVSDGLNERDLPFERLAGEVRIRSGRAIIDEVLLATDRGDLEGSGRFEIAEGFLLLSGRYTDIAARTLADAGAEAFTASQPTPFTVSGSWPEAAVYTR